MRESLHPVKLESPLLFSASSKPAPDQTTALTALEENVLKPFANELLGAANTAANVGNAVGETLGAGPFAGKFELYSTEQAGSGSGARLCQTISSGLGSILPYVVAGQVMSTSLRTAGRLAGAEGTAARLLGSNAAAQVAAAALMDGMRDLRAGETAAGNSAAALVAFGIFEGLNPLTRSLTIAGQLGARGLIGALGASAHVATAHAISGSELSAPSFIDAALSGSFMNAALPMAQRAVSRGLNTVRSETGLSVAVSEYAALRRFDGSPTLDRMIKESPLTNVRESAGMLFSADVRRKIIYLSREADAADLGHELSHIERRAHTDSGAAAAKEHIVRGDEQRAKASLAEVFELDERIARRRESDIAAELNLSRHFQSRARSSVYQSQLNSIFDALKIGTPPRLIDSLRHSDRWYSAEVEHLRFKDMPKSYTLEVPIASVSEMVQWQRASQKRFSGQTVALLQEAQIDGRVDFRLIDRDFIQSRRIYARDTIRATTQRELRDAEMYDPLKATQPVLIVKLNTRRGEEYHVINGNNRVYLFGSEETNSTNRGLPVWIFNGGDTFQAIFGHDPRKTISSAHRLQFNN